MPEHTLLQLNADRLPSPGQDWIEPFHIDSELPDPNGNGAWLGRLKEKDTPLVFRVSRGIDEHHAEAWESLGKLHLKGIANPFARVSCGQRRIEVTELPPGSTLQAWRKGLGKSPDEDQIKALVKALVTSLQGLHMTGLVHLNLRTDNIFVESNGESLTITLGGLDVLTRRDQSGLIPISVDPFLGPPETAGLYKHSPGPNLEAWDYWCLGRILQECILGQHVLGTILDRDVSRVTHELQTLAADLQQEKLPGHVRAGAVEAMPELAPRLQLLLKGLLSACIDARWRDTECHAWLEGASPAEHYSLSLRQRCFRFAGEAHTVAEAAAALQDDEHWEQAEHQLFDDEHKDGLATFIRNHGSQSQQEKLQASRALLNEDWFGKMEKEAVREVLTAIVLLNLTGGKLVWRGQHLDHKVAAARLEMEDGKGFWLHCVQIFCSPPVLGLLDTMDSEAERVLRDIGHLAEKATAKAIAQGWVKAGDNRTIARLWSFACQGSELAALLRSLRDTFACSLQTEPNRLFQQPHAAADEQVILAFMTADPKAFGFITHEEWATRRYAELHAKAVALAELLFWKRLRAALGSGPWWFGRIWWLILAWGGIALAVAVIKPGPLWLGLGLLPAFLALGLRAFLVSWLRPLMQEQFPNSEAWRFLDGPARCARGMEASPYKAESPRDLLRQLDEANQEIASLRHLQGSPKLVPAPSTFRRLRLAATSSWLVLAALGAFCVWQARIHPPSLARLTEAWHFSPDLSSPKEETAKPKETRIEWTFKAPSEAREPKITGTRTPTAEETKQALARGEAMLAKFIPDTISAPILVPLPSEQGYLFALYDGKKKALADKNLIQMGYYPMARSWVEIEGKKVYVYVE